MLRSPMPPLAAALRRPVLLCLVAGYVDAFGYIQLGGVFPANMTGNTVLMAAAAAERDWPRVTIHAQTLGAFFLGALAASVLKRSFDRRFIPLACAAALLVVAQVASGGVRLELLLVTGSMALQGASLSRFGKIQLQTVVVTSTILRFADAIVGRYWRGGTRAQGSGGAEVWTPGAAWLAYAAGAGAGAIAFGVVRAPLAIPALLLAAIVADLAIQPAD